jgi:mannose-1-phosphate guanylyltransferase/mannose-1-phosphate guanylyltransferase/mannose-6-phosphate isomerase
MTIAVMNSTNPTVVPVILSGGSGTRLWPLSRKLSPKQFVPMLSGRSLFQDTVARAVATTGADPVVVCNETHQLVVEEQLEALGVAARMVVLEPVARNTAAAITAVTLAVAEADPAAHLLVLPSDHYVPDAEAFAADVRTAAKAATAGHLVTFGITPRTAHTGYGYIRQGAPIAGAVGAFEAEEFVEKPAQEVAEQYVAEGKWHWNSGMFLMPVSALLGELSDLQPDIVDCCRTAVTQAVRTDRVVRLDPEAFAASPSISVDYAVMERTTRAAVVPTDLAWNDVGAWSSMWEVSEHDAHGNVAQGNVLALDTADSYVYSDGPLVATLGVSQITVVATKDAVLVTDRAHSQAVRALVDELHGSDHPEADAMPVCRRPWGTYESVHRGERHQVKHIVVRPGGKLSLQRHQHRAEHWVVVRGTARVVRGDETLVLTENMGLYVDRGEVHRLENPGTEPLPVIEVQFGDYLGEDDIERLDDCYGRA